MNDFNVVGTSVHRHEALLKALGTAEYTDDIVLSNMAYGLIIRSPHSHARVISIDTGEAKTVEGFLGVLTFDDVPKKHFNCSGNPPSALLIPDETILTNHPLCLGDRIAAVAALTLEACEMAARKIKIEYEVLPAVFKIPDALKENAPVVQPDISENNIIKTIIFKEGDTEDGFEKADFIFEDSFTTGATQHVALELTSCLCDCRRDGKIVIWSPSQTIYQERRILAELLDMKESDIRIIKPAMGGGFGARQQLHNQHIGCLLSRLVKRPIKIVNTREEDMYASVTRHESFCHIKIGILKNGTIRAAEIKNYINAGPYTTHSLLVSAAAGRKFQYTAPDYLYEGNSVYTNAPTAGAFRGYGNIQLVFGREVLLDRIARKLQLDPMEFKLKNHVAAGQHFPSADYPILSCEIWACVTEANKIKAEIDLKAPLLNNEYLSEAWGSAVCCHSSGASNKEGMSSAVIMVNDDGTITLSIGSADIGQGSETVMSQIAAEALGLTYRDVAVIAADTAATPYDTGTFASGQTFICGNAVTIACRDVIQKVIAGLENFYEAETGEVAFSNDFFVIDSPNTKTSLSLKQAANLLATGMKGRVLIGSGSYKALGSPPPFAVCYAKIRHDKRTNSIQLRDIIEIVDVGTAINPESVKGQIEGGIVQGIGYVMTENMEQDKRSRKMPTSDLLHYKVPLTVDLPDIHVGIVESYEPTGPFGAKSVGELTIVPVAPAIVNAIERATGEHISSIPISNKFMPKGHRRLSPEGGLL